MGTGIPLLTQPCSKVVSLQMPVIIFMWEMRTVNHQDLSFRWFNFIDAAIPDITVTGYSTKSVYDLAYNESTKMLYASGDGFVASFDVSSISCGNNFIPSMLYPTVQQHLQRLPFHRSRHRVRYQPMFCYLVQHRLQQIQQVYSIHFNQIQPIHLMQQ